jgi:hypothetical protein
VLAARAAPVALRSGVLVVHASLARPHRAPIPRGVAPRPAAGPLLAASIRPRGSRGVRQGGLPRSGLRRGQGRTCADRSGCPVRRGLWVCLFAVPFVGDYLAVRLTKTCVGWSRHWVAGRLGFSRSRDQEGPGRNELPGSSAQLQCAGRCGGGVPKPGLLQDGDGTDGRTGWPAVIRGRHEQYRSIRSAVFE